MIDTYRYVRHYRDLGDALQKLRIGQIVAAS